MKTKQRGKFKYTSRFSYMRKDQHSHNPLLGGENILLDFIKTTRSACKQECGKDTSFTEVERLSLQDISL